MTTTRDLAPDQGMFTLELPGRSGVRLDQFQMLNWGTFDGAVQRLVLDGGNGLLTGQVGAGKSTLVDGLTTLFAQTNKVTFNRAAGADRSERTVATYVLGHHRNIYDETTGTARPEALRTAKTAYSVLLARFSGVPHAPDGKLTAGVVFWFGDSATPNRMYFTVGTHLDIHTHLVGHRDIKAVRTALRGLGADLSENNFRTYQRNLCRALGITPAALDLLVQTISMKQVGNLTDFVRAHMLDAVDARERITKILEHYQDLTRAHELVKVAREQLTYLAPVADLAARYERADVRIGAALAAVDAVPARVEQHRVGLLTAAIADLDRQFPDLTADLNRAKSRLADQETIRTQLAIAIEREGGAELTEARHQVKAAEERLSAVKRAVNELFRLANQAGLAAPEDTAGHADFLAAVAAAEQAQHEAEQALRTRDFDAQQALAEARRELKAVEDELAAAGSRDSNVPIEDATLRARLAADLGLEAADLPYAAELLAVDEEAAEWEAAAERLTRAFALSLLVPDQHYKRVAAWVDEHHLGRRLTYFQVPALAPVPVPAQAGTMAACLKVRDRSSVSAWLRAEVNRRYDHVLVTNAADIAAHQRAVTQAGQVKDGTRHVKDDRQRADDRRYYVLGWDTAARRAVLLAALPEKRQAVEDAIRHSDTVGLERSGHGDRGYALRQIRERFADPADVDLGTAVDALTDARDIYDLFANDVDLARLMKEQEECEGTIVRLHEEQSKLDRRLGAAADRLGSYQRAKDAAERQLAAVGAPALADDAAEALAEALRAVGSEPTTVERCETWGRDVTAELHQRAESARATRDRSGQRLVGAMKDFAGKWPEVVVDIPTADPAGRTEFLALRDRLERDDLPSYEQNFREQLETNAIHELVAFSNLLDRESKNITARIETINGALAGIDYRPGTYIRLEAEHTVDPVVREFRGQLRDITSNALLGDDDTYAETRFLKVKDLLDRFAGREGSTSADQAWTNRVTDVRNWYSFAASERARETDEHVEHYADSGGKSGGQKEKLAYTILAASLSYQYGLAGGHHDAFRFVMIDEAFGRGSEESTRFGLELFTRLGLQLLVVTPLQKIATIEPFVEAVGYVRNDDPRSRLVSMTISEYRAQRDQRRANQAATGSQPPAGVTTLGQAAGHHGETAADDDPADDDLGTAVGGSSW